MSTKKYICIAPIETECGESRIEIGVVGDEIGHENDDAIPEAQVKVEDEEVAPTASVSLAGHVEPEEIRRPYATRAKPGRVAMTTKYEEYDDGERIDEVYACRVCLLTDCILYPLVEHRKENFYTQVTGLSLDEDDGLPRSLCAECYTLLNKCIQFRQKSHIGYQCLMKILENNSEVTVDIIKKTNRKKFKLNSNLTIVQKKPNFDYQLVDKSDIVFDENETKQELTLQYNTLNEDDHLDAMSDDTKSSTECDTTETTITQIEVPLKIVKKRKTGNIEGEKITLENVVTDNACKNFEVEPVIVVEKYNLKAEDKLKRSKKQLHLKAKVNSKRQQIRKKIERLINDYFTTKALSTEEQKERMLKRKFTDNYKKSAYKCDYCFKGLKSKVTYKSHMMKHTEKYGKFVCDICHIHFTVKHRMKHHIVRHSHLYACVSCSYTTQNRCSAKLHAEWHKGKKYKCNECGMVFLRSTSLFSHLRIRHLAGHVCHICGYSFISEAGLNAHCKMKHREDSGEVSSDSPRCAECDITFISESALETHLKVSRRHASLGKLKRNEPYVFEKKRDRDIRLPAVKRRRVKEDIPTNWREPIKGVKQDVPRNRRTPIKGVKEDVPTNWREPTDDGNEVTCIECNREFPSRPGWLRHMRMKHPTALPLTSGGRNVLCDICGRVFTCESLLRNHVLMHSEFTSYSCEICGKRFKTRMQLRVHSRAHTESYPCPRCGKTFNRRSNREKHLTLVHVDTRDVKCDFCEKSFKNEIHRKAHTDHVHLKKPWPKRNRDRRAKDGQTVAKRKSGKGITDDLCAEQAE